MGIIGLILLRTTRVEFSDSNGKFNESFGLNMNALAEALEPLCVCLCVRACVCIKFLSHASKLIL
jgi:hypothetical protein